MQFDPHTYYFLTFHSSLALIVSLINEFLFNSFMICRDPDIRCRIKITDVLNCVPSFNKKRFALFGYKRANRVVTDSFLPKSSGNSGKSVEAFEEMAKFNALTFIATILCAVAVAKIASGMKLVEEVSSLNM